MKLHWGFLFAAFVTAAPSHAAASITYSLNLATTSVVGGGTETFTGTLTTDGTLGVLSASNLLDWAINGAGPVPIGVSLGGFLSSVSCGPGGCGVTATSSGLDFTDGASAGLTFENEDGFINFTTLQIGFGGAGFGYPYLISVIIAPSFGPPTGGFFGYSTATIASVSSTSTVAEPSTLALLAIALTLIPWRRAVVRNS